MIRICYSEWADSVSSALEDGNFAVNGHHPPAYGAQPASEALQNAKRYIMNLEANQGFKYAAFGERNSISSRISRRFTNRLILNQSVNATIVQAKDIESGNSVMLKVNRNS
jgi:hypothetical protein